jgi:hypothetical protein
MCIAMQQHSKHLSTATDVSPTVEELEVVFSMQSVRTLCNEDSNGVNGEGGDRRIA